MTKNREYLANSRYTKTSAFLLHTVGVTVDLITSYGFKNAYLRDIHRPDDPDYCLYLLFDPTSISDFEDFASMIRNLDNFYDEYDTEDSYIMFVLKVFPQWKEVIDKFKEGKYSKIPREYVNKFFTPKVYKGVDSYGLPIWKNSKNYMILTADETLKKEIEKDLDVTLKEDSEVFSKPNHHEYYNEKVNRTRK